MKNNNIEKTEGKSTRPAEKNKQDRKLHYQVYLDENRPLQPKDVDEIEY
ncbi:hypothetical protein MM300_17670 [Evansella sp. LMS18]|jgi:hypothetical protein|nr:hypothetical protein [Evansella sp. LMS18]UTR09702.1 hypothetical protein MM300_17670 [Evansella sp. LMS18]